MSILDKAKGTAGRARRGAALSRERLTQVKVRRQRGRLVRQLGGACYAEHRGEGSHEAVAGAFAALDAHERAHPRPSAPGGPSSTAPVRQARDIMHPGAECIGAGEMVADAARKMRDLGVGSLPVCGADDRLHGILTDRDIVVRCIAEGRDPAEIRAGELATGALFWIQASAGVGEVLHQMEDHQVKHLPVIDNHRLVGMITQADLARTLDEHRLAEFVEKIYMTA